MKNGTMFVEPVSGLKLMVVEPALPGFNPKASELSLQGRSFVEERAIPAGMAQKSAVITCDPGDRSKG